MLILCFLPFFTFHILKNYNLTHYRSDVQPGTPLADEPIDHHLPIQTIGQEHYNNERYPAGHKYSRSHRGAPTDREEGRRRYPDETNEPQSISTIGTIANTSQKYFVVSIIHIFDS